MGINIKNYLKRINYSGSVKPDLETLQNLQRTHLLSIPFENLDIHYNIPIQLSIDRMYDKIIHHNRGGFCYELNGIFYELLLALGFDAIIISARIFSKEKVYAPKFDHMAIIVNLDDKKYLVDVGFGEFTFEPLQIILGPRQKDARGDFCISEYQDGYLQVNKFDNNKKTPQYIFKPIERELSDFEGMCQYHQSSPDSHFTKNRLITLPNENGRITISGNTLKLKENDKTTKIILSSNTEFKNALWTHFQIKAEDLRQA